MVLTKTPRGATGLTTPMMSAHESSSDESDDASASPSRPDAGSSRGRRAASNASSPSSSSRAALGLAFLRRDLARSVSRSATVDSIRPDAGDVRASSGSSRGPDALLAERISRLPSTTAAAVSVASASATRRRGAPAPASYGETLERGLRDAKRRVARARERTRREAMRVAPELHDARTGEKLPTRCDYEEAQRLGLVTKLKTANECSRRLGLATRYRAVVRADRGVHVEARAARRDDGSDETADAVTKTRSQRNRDRNRDRTRTSVTFARLETESVPARLLSVRTFLNSEARLWAQARYLETDARRAAHPSKRAARPVTEIEKAIAPPEW